MLTHRYAPRNNCLRAYRERVPELLLSGPAGTGKSRALLEKLHTVMMMNPGARGLIVRKTQESMTSSALVTWREHVISEALLSGEVHFYGGSKEQPGQYRYRNGSRVMLGGMDKPTKVMSTEYDIIYVQEAIELTLTDWESLNARLRNGAVSFQQLMADTNPDVATHWLNQRASSGAVLMLESRHTDNPVLYDLIPDDGTAQDGDVGAGGGQVYRITQRGASYLERLRNLTGVRRQRLYEGLWVSAEGVILDEYDPAVHLVDAFEIPDDWPRYWSIDFGWRHPFACTMWATDGDGTLYCYRQHVGTLRTVEDWAQIILRSVRRHRDDVNWPDPDPNFDGTAGEVQEYVNGRVVSRETPARTACHAADHWKDDTAVRHYQWTEPQPQHVVCDHDAEGRETLSRLIGMQTVPAYKKVNEGNDLVNQRLRDRRLFILRGSLVEPDKALQEAHRPTCLEEEIPGYRWKDGDREVVLKVMDDVCDTMRYEVVEQDRPNGVGVRWL